VSEQHDLFLMKIAFLHQPCAENHRNQSYLVLIKGYLIRRFKLAQRGLGGAHQTRVEAANLFRQRVINTDSENAAVERLRQMNIKLIAQSLVIAERPSCQILEAMN
jgi:hypothetical protein